MILPCLNQAFSQWTIETMGIQLHPSKFLKPQSHVRTIFLHTEGNISMVNGLFHFQSKHHNGGASIRLLHAMTSNITINGNQRGQVVKALCRGLSRVEPENGPVLKCQNFCEQAVCVSEFAKWPSNFCFLAFGDSIKRMILATRCMKCSLYSKIVTVTKFTTFGSHVI